MRSIELLNKVKINGKDFIAAEYKGVPFYVESSTTADGRKINVTETPDGTPIYQDTGRSTPTIDCTGYFLDHGVLKSAIEQYENAMRIWNNSEGAGELIHPQRQGVLLARSGTTPANDDLKSGIVRFSINFYIERVKTVEKTAINYKNLIAEQNKSILQSLQDGMNDFFSVINKPQSVFDAAIDSTREVLNTIETLKDGLRKTAGYRDKLLQLQQNLDVIVLNAQSLGESLINLVTYTPYEPSSRLMISDNLAISKTKKSELETGLITDETTQQIESNNTQLNNIITVGALTEISKYSTEIKLDSVSNASELIKDINDSFNNLMENTTDFELFNQVQRLLTYTIDSLELRAKGLPSVREYKTPETTSIFNVTQSFYGDNNDKASDILTRNNIIHPMFIPGDKDLEILV